MTQAFCFCLGEKLRARDVRLLMMAFIYSSMTEGSDLPPRMCLPSPELEYRLAWKKLVRRYSRPPVHETLSSQPMRLCGAARRW
jgi:hypothetical protein